MIKSATQKIRLGYISFLGALFVIPQMTLAAECALPGVKGVQKLLLYPACFVNKFIIPLAIALELMLFIVGIIRYVSNAENEEKRNEGNKFIGWGIIALFVTISIWGILGLVANTVQLGTV